MACLGYMSQQQRDRVGLITFDSQIVDHIPSSAKHFNVLLHTLDRARAEAAQPEILRQYAIPTAHHP